MQVVHIDLGVAFEQGRFLNTPELVPFRLTRDVVDGMGATGSATIFNSFTDSHQCRCFLSNLAKHVQLTSFLPCHVLDTRFYFSDSRQLITSRWDRPST
jgi:hypothetical protein